MTDTTATAPAPAPDAPAPTWGTWRHHDNLSALTYYGKSLKGAEPEGVNLLVSAGPMGLQGLTEGGKLVLTGGIATRFWATPWADAPSNQADEPPAHAEGEAPKTDKPAKAKAEPKTPHSCRCGACSATCLGTYAPGHDARHVSLLRGRVIAGELTEDGALHHLIHAPKLQAKLSHSLQLAREAEAKREQAARDKAAEKAAAKADADATPTTAQAAA